jgi:hypothetical protein
LNSPEDLADLARTALIGMIGERRVGGVGRWRRAVRVAVVALAKLSHLISDPPPNARRNLRQFQIMPLVWAVGPATEVR